VSAFIAAGDSDALGAAYACCEEIARRHYENFPVASRLVPRRMRPHIAAIYAFARRADDFADEPGREPAERLRLLDDWHRQLDAARSGAAAGSSADDRAIFRALAHTIRACDLPVSLFEDLLSAFRQDVTTTRYRTWGDVLDYCRRSANPVGRLVLRVAGHRDAALDGLSDAVCTGLQLANFWQDLAVDWRNGRLYVPLDDRDRAAATDAELDAGRITPAWQSALAEVVHRTRELFAAGRPICTRVPGRLGWELRLTWLGGTRILDKLERHRYDVFNHRPTLGPADAPGLLWRAVIWT
jgi:hydroxysqualene synthase